MVKDITHRTRVVQGVTTNAILDNKADIDIANNPVQHDRTKYVEIDHHFIKEKLDRGIICMSYVSSSSQVADILTKGLPEKTFSIFCSKMGLYDIFTPS